jgi:hypothetical protein
MNQKSFIAFILSLLGGLWMLSSGRILYGGLGRMPLHTGWGMRHMMWGRGLAGQVIPGLWWPWFGILAGAIVVVSAILFYLVPRHRRSLAITILVASVLNLFLGMGGFLASVLGIAGSIAALSPAPESQA